MHQKPPYTRNSSTFDINCFDIRPECGAHAILLWPPSATAHQSEKTFAINMAPHSRLNENKFQIEFDECAGTNGTIAAVACVWPCVPLVFSQRHIIYTHTEREGRMRMTNIRIKKSIHYVPCWQRRAGTCGRAIVVQLRSHAQFRWLRNAHRNKMGERKSVE